MTPVLAQLQNLPSSTRWTIGSLAVLTILYAILRPMRRKKDPLARQPSSLSGQRSVEREMSNVLVELSEMARQVTGQLDTRAAKLEMLIKEADDKIATLKLLAAASPATTGNGGPAPARRLGAGQPPTAAIDPRHAEVYILADQGHTPRQIAQQLSRPDGEIELILALRERG